MPDLHTFDLPEHFQLLGSVVIPHNLGRGSLGVQIIAEFILIAIDIICAVNPERRKRRFRIIPLVQQISILVFFADGLAFDGTDSVAAGAVIHGNFNKIILNRSRISSGRCFRQSMQALGGRQKYHNQ
ncbi:hypothetical protein D3C73_1057410 [compost metagenome]